MRFERLNDDDATLSVVHSNLKSAGFCLGPIRLSHELIDRINPSSVF
jgi:hypothetical protein